MREEICFVEPDLPGDDALFAAHTKEYIHKLRDAGLSAEEILTLELPYSRELVLSAELFCGGTVGALDSALKDGLGINLGGGFHHAFPDHGEGFCVLNDIAVAVKKVINKGMVKKALIVDCDLHQGNGTAQTFRDDSNVFTFSIHQENNYPFYKPKSDLDIGLRDRVRDREYIGHLERVIPTIISDFKPECIMYVAGADPYEHDQIGNLALTKGALKRRDYFVCDQAKNYGIPIAIVLAGGYSVCREDTVEIQFNTIKTAVKMFNK